MSLFTKILEKLGLKKGTSGTTTSQGGGTAGTPSTSRNTGTGTAGRTPTSGTGTSAPARPGSSSTAKPSTGGVSQPGVTGGRAGAPADAPKAMSEVDVVKQLEERAKGSGLNWKVSIVDLLKLLDLDSSREARNELAQELGCPPELMKDSAKMNTWLHKEVLRQVAANGGNIPQSLLD